METAKEVKELRESMGMNRREFCDYFEIPYRTVQDWEAGKREMPAYVLRLMKYQAGVEKLVGRSTRAAENSDMKKETSNLFQSNDLTQ